MSDGTEKPGLLNRLVRLVSPESPGRSDDASRPSPEHNIELGEGQITSAAAGLAARAHVGVTANVIASANVQAASSPAPLPQSASFAPLAAPTLEARPCSSDTSSSTEPAGD